MKNKLLKLISLITLAAILILCLASCGASASVAGDASGTWNGIAWEYVKDGQTLTLRGTGAMTNAESADTVGWASIRASVKKISISSDISTIGDYAFYGMSQLESVTLPDSIIYIGKCAFAFCKTLEGVNIPAGVATVGESAFEGCSSLKSIKLPTGLTALGERAFAFCHSLETALLPCQIETIGSWAFKDCKKLTSLTVLSGYGAIASDALEGAGIKADAVKTVENPDATTTVIVHYKDADGNSLKDSKTTQKNIGESFSEVAPTIEGYNVSGDKSFTGTADGQATVEHTFKYVKAEAATDAPEETPDETDAPAKKDEGIGAGTIAALCIFGVVIIGICIGAFLLIRSDKKQRQNGSTVRKSNSNTNKRK